MRIGLNLLLLIPLGVGGIEIYGPNLAKPHKSGLIFKTDDEPIY